MPTWFAKTKEMAAFDRHFSMVDVDEAELRERYLRALGRIKGDSFYDRSEALETQWQHRPTRQQDLTFSLDQHFRGDWVHHLFPQDRAKYGSDGGRFWPKVASTTVVDVLRTGLQAAICKALGDTELKNLGVDAQTRHTLWKHERENDIPIDDGIRPTAMSWNCVAPAGDVFFEAEALRGPTVVEFAIATPRPYGHGSIMGLVDDVRAGVTTLGEGGGDSSS